MINGIKWKCIVGIAQNIILDGIFLQNGRSEKKKKKAGDPAKTTHASLWERQPAQLKGTRLKGLLPWRLWNDPCPMALVGALQWTIRHILPGGGWVLKKKRLKSVLVTARGRQEGSPNLNYIWLLKECLMTVQALQISACSGDLARTELHPIIKASRGLWFHRFREIWRLCENVILSFHTTSTYWDSTNKQSRRGVNNFCQSSWWIAVGLFKQAARPTGWSPLSIVCFRSFGPVWLSADKKRRNSQLAVPPSGNLQIEPEVVS